jgi:hypothetical protein
MITGSMFRFSAERLQWPRALHPEHFLIYDQHDLNPFASPWKGCKLNRIVKGCANCFTHLVNGDIAHEGTMLILESTHGFSLCSSLLSYSASEMLLIQFVP